MESNQPAKGDFDVNSLQNQDDDNDPSLIEEAGASIEGFAEELNPLKIGSILEKIFSNLDVESIKNARQVNPLWSIEGAKMLITKCYLKIPSNLQVQNISNNGKEIEEFKAFLSCKSSDHSMIPNIIINKIGDAELWKSLGVLGQKVKSLKLNDIQVESNWLLKLLNLLPSLKHLHFPDNLSFWEGKGSIIVRALISVMSAAEKDQSPLVISCVGLIIGNKRNMLNVEELEDAEKFADFNNIMIEELKFSIEPIVYGPLNPQHLIRISKLINKLLATSRNIIKKLTLKNCKGFLPLLELPRMPALIYLDLIFLTDFYNQSEPCKFSPSFRFSEKLPNLIHFSFNVYGNWSSDAIFVELFPHAETVSSVKSLKYSDGYLDLDFYPLLRTFPNTEEFETTESAGSKKMFETLWKHGANLKKLHFGIDAQEFDEVVSDLDSIFTGFTSETVDKIKKTPNLDFFALEELEELRVNPSILNLKDLEHLTIHFSGHYNTYYPPHRFLAIACNHAFSRLPKNPEIFIHLQKGLRSLEDTMNAVSEVSKIPNVTVVTSN